MLAHQGDELLGGNEKRNRINETQQSQNNKSRQPIGVSACEKLIEDVLVIHGIDIGVRVPQSFNAQHRLLNQRAIRNSGISLPARERNCQGGELNPPTNPECFRGCSTAASDRLLASDSSFALAHFQSFAPQVASGPLSWR